MHKKHEPCKDTTHLGTEDFLKHLQSLPSYANQVGCLRLYWCVAAHRWHVRAHTHTMCNAVMNEIMILYIRFT